MSDVVGNDSSTIASGPAIPDEGTYPVAPPACILSGGETTVTLKGKGKGGRNQEFVLACAMDIESLANVVILSGGTDGAHIINLKDQSISRILK